MRSTYGERHGTFLSNAGLVQLFNVADVDAASWVSRTISNVTESYVTTSESITNSPATFVIDAWREHVPQPH